VKFIVKAASPNGVFGYYLVRLSHWYLGLLMLTTAYSHQTVLNSQFMVVFALVHQWCTTPHSTI
jgi:hypothetical protein